MENRPTIVIIGAGFAGISMAKSFKHAAVNVLLIDKNNYHNFQPLLYQIATGGLEPDSIAYPVRRIFRGYENISVRMADVLTIHMAKQEIVTSVGNFNYDYLIIATGSTTNYFNFDKVKNKLLTLKSIPDALNLRSFIFQNLEKALVAQEHGEVSELLSVAIVGGGPAGIELAGALAEMKRFVIPKDFPDLNLDKMEINLYEASPKLLGAMSEISSAKALSYLKKLGVKVYLNTLVSSYDGTYLQISNNEAFKTNTVIWTAGVKGAPIDGLPNEAIGTGNRILVNAYNQVSQTDRIFAIGDVAACITDKEPKGLPMLAPVAQQQGKLLAKNIVRLTKGQAMKPFKYYNKGVMATIGRKKAVVDLPKWKFQGTFAWIIWMFLHIMALVGFRNKFVAFFDWMSNYFTYDKPLGLIIRPYKKKDKPTNT
ncbi:NAD(P)/FAD-dependent oxidoreductase [Flavobacteriaceae bacterium F08102]|nr:NAD(P)/FAD-dependent oxidoreductase [Flavobacteriaceae bacterium F08102]